jgi:hypothetical protein
MAMALSTFGAASSGAAPRRTRHGGVALLVGSLGLIFAVTMSRLGAQPEDAFTSGSYAQPLRPRALRSNLVQRGAEEAAAPAAPAPSPSVALVKVTDESAMTTASVLGGVLGLLVGGVWVGGAAFAAASFFARKQDSDLATGLKGVAASGLEALNFGAYLNDKYEVTGSVGSSFSSVIDNAKTADNTKEAASTVSGILSGVGEAIDSVDKDVGIKDTIGTVLMSGSELAASAVDKAFELNEQYKVTDQIVEKITEATKGATSSTK